MFSIFFVILALIAVAGFHRLYNANPNQIILSFLAASVFILESMLTRYMEPSQGLLDVLELLLLSLGFASLAFGAFIIPRLEKKKNISQ